MVDLLYITIQLTVLYFSVVGEQKFSKKSNTASNFLESQKNAMTDKPVKEVANGSKQEMAPSLETETHNQLAAQTSCLLEEVFAGSVQQVVSKEVSDSHSLQEPAVPKLSSKLTALSVC